MPVLRPFAREFIGSNQLQNDPTKSVTVTINDTGPFAHGPDRRALQPLQSEAAIPYLIASLDAAVGHGGAFDYQRKGNPLTGYTQLRQFQHVSNLNVGLFCQQAGLTLEEILSTAGLYARLFSSNAKPAEPYGLDPENTRFTTIGFNIGQSGMFTPSAPP